ncbi:3',5'-cyclic adenosine monophosphate phosphodiesterase CpdA [Zhongshania aliphaticivorans]|uniref:3',5'-cyclic adenosine monophosphate phosphodiesterase CpdA n=1 Tax=Zhongshania aliphaticivorans TaxID=1470434 RepID=A0A5S9PGX5_9GAMM|nr:3',5'-cyclic adenosine monophosphate phosphodiesterase CpdA [Zhongshania aliphaticivorans]CAA0113660.1 3',5'-cyclic adenosine monophosphate phosphodiesterase CpdA [Zhongshania aliphaticivorans]
MVQISDCHLGAHQGDSLLGMDTDHSLEAVLATIASECPVIDLLIVSGDIAAHGDAASYQRLLARLDGVASQMVWLPGNHDDADLMLSVAGEKLMPSELELGGWRLGFLNSAVKNEVGGLLAADQLEVLKGIVACEQPSLVFLHHHLRALGCAWLDEQRVANADDVFAIADAGPQLKAFVSGHVHQHSEMVFQNKGLLTTPSTCIQFAPDSDSFALDDSNPGYRIFWLAENGQFQTRVSRVKGVTFTVDNLASGYE